jgi:hypothetical protein
MAKKILLRYWYAPSEDTDNNEASAMLATYKEALEEVRLALLDLPDPSQLPADLPENADSLLYFDGDECDWTGQALSWGTAPRFCMNDTPSESRALIVDGRGYYIEDFEDLIDRDPEAADRLRAEQEARK